MPLIIDILLIAAEAVIIVALADFVAGVIHWLEDAYFDENTPLIGSRIIRPNIVHHHLPRYFTQLSWWQSSRDLLLASLILVALSLPFGFFGWQVVLFALVSTNANQIHKWAHRTRRENGRLISLLQDWRILQTPHHHGLHHTDPKNTYYCPVTNFVNPILERTSFWPRLEAIIEKLTGIRHRDDTSLRGQGPGPEWLTQYRRPSPSAVIPNTRPTQTSATVASIIQPTYHRFGSINSSVRGSASALTIVTLVIAGWTLGLLMQPLLEARTQDRQFPDRSSLQTENPKPAANAVVSNLDDGTNTKTLTDD